MKRFNYNGKEYEVQGKQYEYNGENYNCLYIKTDDFECVVDGMNGTEINDDFDFKIVLENEYLITGYDCLELVKSFN